MALIKAGRNGDINRVKALLDLNVDTQIKDKYGKTVLYYAAEKGHEPVVRLLLEQGADVNAQGGFYGNALQAASSRGDEPVVRLLRAAKQKQLEPLARTATIPTHPRII